LAGAFLACLAVAANVWLNYPSPQLYEGKTVEEWAVQADSPDPRQQTHAFDVLHQILSDGKPPFRIIAAARIFMSEPGAEQAIEVLVQGLQDPDPGTRAIAAATLVRLRPQDPHFPETVRRLLALLPDEDRTVGSEVTNTLCVRHGDIEDRVPELVALLDHPRPQARARAAQVLGSIGEPAASADSALTRLLQDEEPAVREQARYALPKVRTVKVQPARGTAPDQ
jgi:HEAT repeat protein